MSALQRQVQPKRKKDADTNTNTLRPAKERSIWTKKLNHWSKQPFNIFQGYFHKMQ